MSNVNVSKYLCNIYKNIFMKGILLPYLSVCIDRFLLNALFPEKLREKLTTQMSEKEEVAKRPGKSDISIY